MPTPENLHANIPDDQRHNPKGFDNAGGGSTLGKNLAGELVYDIDYWQAPAIEFVDMALAPPSESNGDRYVLVNLTSSVVHADWDGAVENDIVEFYAAGTVWNALSPFEDLVIRDSNNATEYYFDGTAYQSAGGGGAIGGSGTADYISRFTSSTDLGNSTIRDNGTTSAINGAVDAAAQLKVYSTLTQGLEVSQTGTGAIKAGFNVVTSGANASTQYGGIIDVSNGTGEQRGLFIDVDNSSGGAGYGMQSSVVSGAGSNMDAGSFFVSGTNTARNVAGYFDAQNAGSGTAYAIYSNQGLNYFGGDTTIGNLTFDASQAVGSGQDDYVLTYDHSAGKISLEAAAGGGGGLQPPSPATQYVIPYMNNLGTDADYDANFYYNGSSFNVGADANNYFRVSASTGAITMLDAGAYNLKLSPSAISAGGKIESTTGSIWLQASSSGSYQMWLDRTNKRVGIYTSTPDATMTIQGEGATSATSALKVKNSSATTLFEVKDDGTVEAGGSSLGNVSNTGTPANDQLAVWTDANTIEGSSQLIYQSGAFQVASGGGYIYLYNSGYMRMKKNTTANTLTIDPAYGNQTRSQIATSAGADLFLQSGTNYSKING